MTETSTRDIPCTAFIWQSLGVQVLAWRGLPHSAKARLQRRTKTMVKRLKDVMTANGLGGRFDPRATFVTFQRGISPTMKEAESIYIHDSATATVLYEIMLGSPVAGGKSTLIFRVDSEIERIDGTWGAIIRYFTGRPESETVIDD